MQVTPGTRWSFFGVTHSVCRECSVAIPAKVVTDGTAVYLRQFCPMHGESVSFIRSDPAEYLRTQRILKPASQPFTSNGDATLSCPDGCGFCSRHEQHLCMPIIEITSRCQLACPVCINSSGEHTTNDMTVGEFSLVLDKIIESETQVDVLNISGGEPLLHPEILNILDEALSREAVIRVSVSTNGLQLLQKPSLLEELKGRNVVVALQLDGLTDAPYRLLRGRALLSEKIAVLGMLRAASITTSLVMTVAGSVSEGLFRGMLDLLFDHEHIVSLMLQPVAFTGRAARMQRDCGRLTIPDIVRLLGEAGHPAVEDTDFVPLPCSHPLCFSLAFYLVLDSGSAMSLNRLTDASTMMDALANHVFYGLDPDEHRRLRNMIYDMWSGPVGAVPEGEAVLRTLRNVLRSIGSRNTSFDPRNAFTSLERRVKSIFIHAFQDAETFDLARVRRCCQAYPEKDGKLIPACVRNVVHRRPGKERPLW